MQALKVGLFVGGLTFCVLLLSGCTADTGEDAGRVSRDGRDVTETPAPSPAVLGVEKPQVVSPDRALPVETVPAAPETTDPEASLATATPGTTETLTTQTAAADAPLTTAGRPADVGYEGLTRSINNLERALTPYLTDRTVKISPEVATQLKRQASNYVSEIKNAQSVDKEVRFELRERAIDIHQAVDEMAKTASQERYNVLRAATHQRVEEIQAELMGVTPAPPPE